MSQQDFNVPSQKIQQAVMQYAIENAETLEALDPELEKASIECLVREANKDEK